MTKLLFVPLAALLAGTAAPAAAKTLKWMDAPDGLPKGAQMAVVSGDPGKAGRFAVELKFPADYAVPPHWHPTAERVTVVAGALHYGMSSKMDMAKAKTLEHGHSVTMAAKMNHWVHAAQPATIRVSGRGPFKITYVDPKDDPRNH